MWSNIKLYSTATDANYNYLQHIAYMPYMQFNVMFVLYGYCISFFAITYYWLFCAAGSEFDCYWYLHFIGYTICNKINTYRTVLWYMYSMQYALKMWRAELTTSPDMVLVMVSCVRHCFGAPHPFSILIFGTVTVPL